MERVPASGLRRDGACCPAYSGRARCIEDCAERPPDLAQLAEVSALSKFHLLRLFGETFGATPLEYAQRRRVERAKHLLRHSRLSIVRIAETLGYEIQSAFARTFRRHTATTPRAFSIRRTNLAIWGDTRGWLLA